MVQGSPELAPIAGTPLLWVTNTESDLFYDAAGPAYYFLTSGRWFRAATLEGPWEYASSTLPEDFQRIPADHPRAHVLAAVPGTREAEDAVLLAAIPRTAEVKRGEAKAEVTYVGEPEFVSIPGTTVSYAKNTPSDVLRVGDRYYLCLQGVWFVSASPQGPWQAADSVPQEIYTIPESSPKYNVTYVRIYDSTPTTIVVGYTPGYYGAFVYGGVVVWGTGYYYPPYVAVGVVAVPVYWGAPYYTYGASAWYNPATGIYARGAAVYGPYGGYGAAAAYNPRTGTYAQGSAVWGPNGGAAAGRTYNPSTGTYSAGYRAANPYGSWGEGVVTNGDNWARGGYQSTRRGTVAAGETSKGGAGRCFRRRRRQVGLRRQERQRRCLCGRQWQCLQARRRPVVPESKRQLECDGQERGGGARTTGGGTRPRHPKFAAIGRSACKPRRPQRWSGHRAATSVSRPPPVTDGEDLTVCNL